MALATEYVIAPRENETRSLDLPGPSEKTGALIARLISFEIQPEPVAPIKA